jgi:hypothetical protein
MFNVLIKPRVASWTYNIATLRYVEPKVRSYGLFRTSLAADLCVHDRLISYLTQNLGYQGSVVCMFELSTGIF